MGIKCREETGSSSRVSSSSKEGERSGLLELESEPEPELELKTLLGSL